MALLHMKTTRAAPSMALMVCPYSGYSYGALLTENIVEKLSFLS
jgi:hypothetical protein